MEEKIKKLEQEITKWKYKYNSRNAEYILLHHEFADYKRQRNLWPLLTLTLLLIIILLYSHD